MSSPPSSLTPAAPLPERELRRLLVSCKPEDAARLEAWIAADPDSADNAFAGLSQGVLVMSRRGSIAFTVFFGLSAAVAFGFFIAAYANPASRSHPLTLLTSTLILLFTNSLVFVSRHPSNNAALLRLARQGDTRAVPYLAKVWTSRPFAGQEAALNKEVGSELARLLTERTGNRYDLQTEEALRHLVARAFPSSRTVRLWRRLRPPHDLSEADTNFLLSVVRHLTPCAKTATILSDTAADEATLRRVARFPLPGEHYTLLNDTTQVLLQNGGK